MGMMGRGMGGMATIDRVEGRIAFLRAETQDHRRAGRGLEWLCRCAARECEEARGSSCIDDAEAGRWTTAGLQPDSPAGPAGAMADRAARRHCGR